MLEKYFNLKENKTDIKTEVIGGITAFLSMSYIIFVNPIILADAGMNTQAVFVATILGAFIATMMMGLYAKTPLALAPCMSMNAFFTYGVVLGMGYTYDQALACVLLSSILFVILSLTEMRHKLIEAIPMTIKNASFVGLGLFIAFIGLKNSHIIVYDENTLLRFGDLSNPDTLIAIIGIITLFILLVRKVKFAVIFSMIVCVITGLILNIFVQSPTLPTIPETLVTNPIESINVMFNETFFVAIKAIPSVLTISGITTVFTFMFLDFLSTATTLHAAQNLIDSDKGDKKVYLCDATGTLVGSLLGTSNVTTYIESVSGVVSGARTGLMSVVCAFCFLLSIFFYPLLSLVTSAVTTPALIAIGLIMFLNITTIDWKSDLNELIPAFVIITMMPLTGSIAFALCLGITIFLILAIVSKDFKHFNKHFLIISIVSVIYVISEVI